jgi:type II secretory pathway pseudopilin PulG
MARGGFTVVEALVALVLASLAAAALAASVSAGRRALRLASDFGTGVVAAQDALGTLGGAASVTSGSDAVAGVPPLVREWTVVPGRGRPTSIGVDVRWDTHALRLETARWP